MAISVITNFLSKPPTQGWTLGTLEGCSQAPTIWLAGRRS